jgi:phosphonate transport system permease protein
MSPLSSSLTRLPEVRLRPLMDSYARAVAARRLRSLLALAGVLVCVGLAAKSAEVDLWKLFENFHRLPSYIIRIFTLESGQPVWTDLAEWFWGLDRWAAQLGETILMAYVGTALGAIGALGLCFLAAANVSPGRWTRIATRRFLEICRTVPELVFALVFVISFGLGPLAGVLAVAIHTLGALGKQFAEVVENGDMKPVDGVSSAGGHWVVAMRFGMLPQVLSNFVSYALLRFEINVRGATIMGFVGAGGIGQDLVEAIRKFYYSDVSAILTLVVLTVFVMDFLTERLRHRLVDVDTQR